MTEVAGSRLDVYLLIIAFSKEDRGCYEGERVVCVDRGHFEDWVSEATREVACNVK